MKKLHVSKDLKEANKVISRQFTSSSYAYLSSYNCTGTLLMGCVISR